MTTTCHDVTLGETIALTATNPTDALAQAFEDRHLTYEPKAGEWALVTRVEVRKASWGMGWQVTVFAVYEGTTQRYDLRVDPHGPDGLTDSERAWLKA